MRHFMLALAGLGLVSSAPAPRQAGITTAPRNTPVPRDCPLVVAFASYAAGINRRVYAAVEELLTNDRGVRAIQRHPWGREGEVTLCVRTRTGRDAVRLFHRVKALFPSGRTPPLTVSTSSGLRFRAPR